MFDLPESGLGITALNTTGGSTLDTTLALEGSWRAALLTHLLWETLLSRLWLLWCGTVAVALAGELGWLALGRIKLWERHDENLYLS
jgi:hypothetical protein